MNYNAFTISHIYFPVYALEYWKLLGRVYWRGRNESGKRKRNWPRWVLAKNLWILVLFVVRMFFVILTYNFGPVQYYFFQKLSKTARGSSNYKKIILKIFEVPPGWQEKSVEKAQTFPVTQSVSITPKKSSWITFEQIVFFICYLALGLLIRQSSLYHCSGRGA